MAVPRSAPPRLPRPPAQQQESLVGCNVGTFAADIVMCVPLVAPVPQTFCSAEQNPHKPASSLGRSDRSFIGPAMVPGTSLEPLATRLAQEPPRQVALAPLSKSEKHPRYSSTILATATIADMAYNRTQYGRWR